MEKKVAIFAFNGESMCFAHAMLNALDMNKKNYDIKLIIEGSATKQVKDLLDPKNPFASLYGKVKEAGLIDCVCRACSTKMGSIKSAKEQGLPLCDEMEGHPSISRYLENGYEVIVF
jgi:hypothetical protein